MWGVRARRKGRRGEKGGGCESEEEREKGKREEGKRVYPPSSLTLLTF